MIKFTDNDQLIFDPTPNLKSSHAPICFISFNNENKCGNCNVEYSETPFFKQKYCKYCIKKFIDNPSKCLDIQISTNIKYENESIKNIDFGTPSLQKWYFKQIIPSTYSLIRYDTFNGEMIECEKNCNLCGKLMIISKYNIIFTLCSSCYLISSGWIESALTKVPIPILYLPWWDASDQCVVCDKVLEFKPECLKWCLHCYIIYTGCRYCLTTNIIFGITNESQCRKCGRITNLTIDTSSINSENLYIEEFLVSTRLNINNNDQIIDCINNINKDYENCNPLDKYNDIKYEFKNALSKPIMEWIPYSQITNCKKIAEGGFGIIYKAIWLDASSQYDDFLSNREKNKTVAIKRFLNSQNISKYFLNELKSLYQCYNKFDHIINYHGITKDPETKDYMLIMKYASGGNLHDYLQKNFKEVTWNKKLYILWQISAGLHTIHEVNFIHRDFHSGNILLETESSGKWKIGDLGLSQPANSTSLNNEIYGVIPYIAPEIFQGVAFSKKSDIYSMSMIMWELTTGCKPFDNIEHNTELIYRIIDGKKPKITNDTPDCYANLMRKCWDSDPLKRPSAKEILEVIYAWAFLQEDYENFNQAEVKRLKSIELKKLGPEFTENPHSKAVYKSRSLNSFISFDNSSLIGPQEYISKEYEYDINNI
ncbi:kinase-like domain-containing protein [Rhizophagus irregularis DAOM 181602=DAOM 197198]|uniref:Sps1p n=3 Tax=Rhizophagus irregularis TaxID=588596 RepID=A0A015IS61_RHIIW|nr:Sps1p [Rhizophagus irregularis DAOM 197198w]GBC26749.2 kinase-like domain-containing protein [Rhizophagus irregularis DAOM 181602=DAOM 197198]